MTLTVFVLSPFCRNARPDYAVTNHPELEDELGSEEEDDLRSDEEGGVPRGGVPAALQDHVVIAENQGAVEVVGQDGVARRVIVQVIDQLRRGGDVQVRGQGNDPEVPAVGAVEVVGQDGARDNDMEQDFPEAEEHAVAVVGGGNAPNRGRDGGQDNNSEVPLQMEQDFPEEEVHEVAVVGDRTAPNQVQDGAQVELVDGVNIERLNETFTYQDDAELEPVSEASDMSHESAQEESGAESDTELLEELETMAFDAELDSVLDSELAAVAELAVKEEDLEPEEQEDYTEEHLEQGGDLEPGEHLEPEDADNENR